MTYFVTETKRADVCSEVGGGRRSQVPQQPLDMAFRATRLCFMPSSRGWGSTLPNLHKARLHKFGDNGVLEGKGKLFKALRIEKPRLFLYVSAVSLRFNVWDPTSVSVRELWRQLSAKRVRPLSPLGGLSLCGATFAIACARQ